MFFIKFLLHLPSTVIFNECKMEKIQENTKETGQNIKRWHGWPRSDLFLSYEVLKHSHQLEF